MVDELLEAAERFRAAFRDADLPPPPKRHLAVLTCMDARVHPERVLGLEIGDAHVLRNAGGRVTEDVIRSLVLSTCVLGTRRLAVIHHTDCGLLGAESELRAIVSRAGGDLSTIAVLAFDDLDRSVVDDVAALRTDARLPSGLDVAGYVYDVHAGSLRPVPT